MPDAYRIDECRFLQTVDATSAADATVIALGRSVPPGKIWTLFSWDYYPTATETVEVWFYVLNALTSKAHYFNWASRAFTGYGRIPALAGMDEMKLFPGDEPRVGRKTATAGSSMVMTIRLIESDLPFIKYVEPQDERKRKAGLIAEEEGFSPALRSVQSAIRSARPSSIRDTLRRR